MSQLIMLTQPYLVKKGLNCPGFRCGFVGGSRAIVNPPPKDTDVDLVYHVDNVMQAALFLERNGADITRGDYLGETSDFITLRKGIVNIMLFQCPYEFGAVWGATSYAKSVNMKDKLDRYDFFERVRLPWRPQ